MAGLGVAAEPVQEAALVVQPGAGLAAAERPAQRQQHRLCR